MKVCLIRFFASSFLIIISFCLLHEAHAVRPDEETLKTVKHQSVMKVLHLSDEHVRDEAVSHFCASAQIQALVGRDNEQISEAYSAYRHTVNFLRNYENHLITSHEICDYSDVVRVFPSASTWSRLKCLTSLRLFQVKSDDLSPLSGLVALKVLRLDSGKFSDPSPLGRLVNLEELYLWGSKLSDGSFITALTNLVRLTLTATGLKELPPLPRHKRLKFLDISFTEITDLSPVADLEALEEFKHSGDMITKVKISDLTAFRDLRHLRILSLNGCLSRRADLGDLAKLGLVDLDLGRARIDDISAMGNAETLETLSLAESKVHDLTPLTHYSKLKKLNLFRTNVTRLYPLRDLPDLRSVHLWMCNSLFRAVDGEEPKAAQERIAENRDVMQQLRSRGVEITD